MTWTDSNKLLPKGSVVLLSLDIVTFYLTRDRQLDTKDVKFNVMKSERDVGDY